MCVRQVRRQRFELLPIAAPPVVGAHLEALAVEHGATLDPTDRDLPRFAGRRVVNPLDPASAWRESSVEGGGLGYARSAARSTVTPGSAMGWRVPPSWRDSA
jgi:hypothetical protein